MGRPGVRQAQRTKRARKETPQRSTVSLNGSRPHPASPASPVSRLQHYALWLAALLVGVIALAFDLHQLGGVNVWFDEAFSYVFANRPFGQVWHDMWGPEPNMELYYTLLYGWLRALHLFGLRPTEFWLRLPSAIFAALGAVAVFALGKRLGGWATALIAAMFFILNPLQLYYAQQARSYSMEVFFTTASWYALVAAIETPIAPGRPAERDERWGRLVASRWWILYVAMVTLSAYAQLFTALMLAAQVVSFGLALLLPATVIGAWREQAKRAQRPFMLSVLAIGVACLPLLSAALHGGHNAWVGPATFGELGRFFLVSVSDGSWLYLAVIATLSALAIILGLALPALRMNQAWTPTRRTGTKNKRMQIRRSKTHQSARRNRSDAAPADARTAFAILFTFCWLVVPIALSFALTQPFLNAHLFLDRYLVVAIPAFCLLAALGAALLYRLTLAALTSLALGRMRERWLAWGLTAVLGLALLAMALPQAQGYYASADTQGLHTGAPWIEQRYQPGDGIACYPGSWCMLPMTYYLQAESGPAHFDADSPSDNLSLATLAAYGAKHRRIFLIIAVFHPKPGVLPQLIALRRWADTHWKPLGQFTSSHMDYQYIGAFLITSIMIVLYQTGAKT